MKPLSRRVRFLYLAVSIIAFLFTVPLAVLYASGYRFHGLSLLETGGIYVSVPISDATVFINGKEEGTSGLFTRSFYVDNLVQGSYSVQVSREGYYPWVKKITVEPRVVTDVSAFLVPQSLVIREIKVETESDTASTTRAVSKGEYATLLKAFTHVATSSPSSQEVGATSTPFAVRAGTELSIEEGNLIVRWTKDPQSTPSSFCIKPSSCVQEFALEKGREIVTDAKFFAGGVAYATKASGIFLAENDSRPIQLVIPLYSKPGAQFRIVNGDFIVKDGSILYDLSGF